MVPTKKAVEGSFHGWHYRAVEGEVDWRIAAVHHGLGTPCGRTQGKTQRHIEGPNTYPELRSRVAACRGEDDSVESRACGQWRS